MLFTMSEAVRSCLLDAKGDVDCMHDDITCEVRAGGLHLNREALDGQHGFGCSPRSAACKTEEASDDEHSEKPRESAFPPQHKKEDCTGSGQCKLGFCAGVVRCGGRGDHGHGNCS